MSAKDFCSSAHASRVLLSWVILFFGLILTSIGLQQHAHAAAYATHGEGKYKDLILWMTWGNNQNNSGGLNGQTITSGTPLTVSRAAHPLPGGNVLNVTCTLLNIRHASNNASAVLRSYLSGTYWWDGFNHMYNIGGANVTGGYGGTANQVVGSTNSLVAGVTNDVYGDDIRFEVNCSADINGTPINIPGLVMADAESMASGESIRATAAGTWNIVEMHQNLGVTTPYNVRKVSGPAGTQSIIIADGADAQLSGVTFMKLTVPSSNINFSFEINGGGHTAMAFGLLVPYADFGDAPQTYGDAYHLIQDLDIKPDGVVVDGPSINLNSSAINLDNLGVKGATTNYLGSAGPDAEATDPYSANADGDNIGGFAGTAEEDAWQLPNIYILQANSTLTQTISCHGNGYVAGWIDFNGNGSFDATERSIGSPICNGSTVTLSWNIPSVNTIKAGTSFVRLRISTSSAGLTSATGIAADGEVEDHKITIVAPNFEVTKTSNATAAGWMNAQVGALFTVSVKNVGSVGNNDPTITVSPVNNALKTVTVYDDLPTGINPNWLGTLTTSIWQCTFVGQRITCTTTNNIAPNATSNITIPVSVTTTTNGTLTNYASVGGGFDPYNSGATPVPNSCTPTTDKHCTSAQVKISNPITNVVKTATPAASVRVYPGDEITYTLTATVSERALTSNLVINDPLPAGLEFISVSSNPGGFTDTYASNQSFTLPATPAKNPGTYSISFKARVTDAAKGLGNLVNTATATGGGPIAPTCTSCTTSHPVSVPGLTIAKSAAANGLGLANVGDQIKFSFLIENIGDSTVNSITVTDPWLSAAAVTIPTVASLAPGASTLVEALYTLTAADFAAGKVDNTAYAAGTDPYTRPVRSNDSATSTPLTGVPGITLVKTASTPTGNTAGSTVTYSFLVTNTGNLNLTNVIVNDPLLAAAGVTVPAIGALAANASTTVTAIYTLTTADFSNGSVVNTATAQGNDPSATPIISDPSSVTTPLVQNPVLSLVKSASSPSGNNVGDTITYTFTVTNTGNVPFTGVAIDDILLTSAGVSVPAIGNLAVGETKSVTAVYSLTKANFIAGNVTNTATAEGTPPNGIVVVSPPSDTSTPLVQTPALSLIKTSLPATGTAVGSTIPYSLQVINTGDVPLTNVVISDPLLTDSGIVIPAIASLAVGESQTLNFNYVLTAADFLTGRVDNLANASAQDPLNNTVPSNPSSTVTPLNKLADLQLVKTANAPSGARIGDTITYTFAVTNNGNQPLNSVVINDPLLISAGITVLPVGDVAVGETKTVSADYTLTGADFIAGQVANSAVAYAKDPAGTPYTSQPDDTVTPLTQNPALSLLKSASTPTGATAGDKVSFRFVVENTGNLPLTNVVIDDPLLTAQGIVIAPIGSLAVGEVQIVSADYTLTTADFVNGKLDNTARAQGTDPANTPVTSDPSSTTTPLQQTPAMTMVKSAGAPSGDRAGATVTYTFTVTNTGNLPLTNVTINDDLLTAAGVSVTPLAQLDVGQTQTLSAIYTLTQADFQAGKVINIAQAQAQDSNNTPLLSDPSSTETPLVQKGQLRLVKTASAPSIQQAGEVITYTFSVENIGNVALQNVQITDPMLTAAGIIVAPIGTIAVGQTLSVDAIYPLSQADLDRGQVDNSATAVGRDPSDNPIDSNPSDVTTPLNPNSGLRLQKTASEVQGDRAGASIVYSFEVTNTGATTLNDVQITDGLLANARVALEPIGQLAPGMSKTVTATYLVTQEDFDRGMVENVAQAGGVDPKANPVASNTAETRTMIDQYPELMVKKLAYAPVTDNIGDLVEYSFEVSNTGNVDITNIVINDPMLAAAGVPIPAVGDLAPGQSRRVIATYTLIEPDFTRGYVENMATARGTPPNNIPYESPPSEKIVYLTPTPQLALLKHLRAGPTPVTQTGQVLTYTIEVRNTGNMNLAGVRVDDMLNGQSLSVGTPSGNDGDPNVLEVDEIWTYTLLYTVTQADMDARAPLINRASVTSTTTGVNTPEPAEVIVPIVVPDITALDDRYSTRSNRDNATLLGDALINDTLNGLKVHAEDIRIRVPALPIDGAPQPYMDALTGEVIAPPNTPAGDYEIPYTICERYNANNCADAVVRVSVIDSDIVANDDAYQYDATRTTEAIGNVLLNDSTNHNEALPSNVRIEMIAVNDPALRLDTQTGAVALALDALPGAYHLDYRICQINNTSFCDDARVTISVQPELQLQLSKSTPATQVRLGDVVRYSLTASNRAVGDVTGFTLIDAPPQGFSYVEGSLEVIDRDGRAQLTSASPLRIEGISVAKGESVTITYLLRVGPGAAALGTYTNNARAFDAQQPISNNASASVQRVGDALFEESRIVGSVYLDRDGNRWQAHADATEVFVKGGFAPEVYQANSTRLTRADQVQLVADASAPLLKGIDLGAMAGARGFDQRTHTDLVVLSQRLSEARFTDDFTLRTAEGTRLRLDREGRLFSAPVGDVKRKRNAQAIDIKRYVFPQADGQVLVEYHLRNLGQGERGLPGVRLATVEGLLVTTDAYGRYHIEGNEVENFARGENVLVKVDESTLPAGTRLSTPNPLLKRVTQGLPTRFDFGVTRRDSDTRQAAIDVDLDADLFLARSATLIEAADITINGLRELIDTHAQVRLLLPALKSASESLNLARAQTLQTALTGSGGQGSGGSSFVIGLLDTDGTTWATLDADTLILHKSLQLDEATAAQRAPLSKPLRDALVALVQARASAEQPLYLSLAAPALNPTTHPTLDAAGVERLTGIQARALFSQLAQHLSEEEQQYLRIHTVPQWLAAQGEAQ